MGDRTWVTVRVFRPDLEKFYEATGLDDAFVSREETPGGHPSLFIEEANYGMYSELEQAAAAGCRFEGEHGAGGEYTSAVFACTGEGPCWDCVSVDETPVGKINADGEVDEADLTTARNYWAAYKVVSELLDKPAVVSEMKEALGE